MFRKILYLLIAVYAGILIGEIPAGKMTVGRIVLAQTMNLGNWTTTQAHSLVSYAGLGDSKFFDWLGKTPPVATPAPSKAKPRQTRRDESDPEGLSLVDKNAIRQILE